MAGREIGVGFRLARRLERAPDADLPAEALPIEQERRLGIVSKLAPLGTFLVGVEDKAARVGALQWNHPHVGEPVGIDRNTLGLKRAKQLVRATSLPCLITQLR
jgi:hypothetical protein